MAELRQRSTKFINLEEFNRGQRHREGKAVAERLGGEVGQPRQRKEDKFKGRKEDPRPERDNRRVPPKTKYEEYTPLTVSRGQIWKETMQTELRYAPRPPFMKKSSQRNKSKYCDFHEGYGHTTDQCTWLRDVIEDLVRAGKLQQYVREALGRHTGRRSLTPEGERVKRLREATPEVRGNEIKQIDLVETHESDHSPKHFRVETIAGGFAGGGEKRTDRKRYINQILSVHQNPPKKKPSKGIPICFTDDDLEGIIPDHNDPMVISARIGNYDVSRVFVDQGSSADIMFLSLFQALKLSKPDLTAFEGSLIGFTGDSVRPLGYVKLPITLGKGKSARTELINFLVVDCSSAYNAILGRTCLQAFGAVVSTVHLTMKFVGSDDKVVSVKAEQEKARLCYNASLRAKAETSKEQWDRKKAKGKVMLAELDVRAGRDDLRPEPQGNWELIDLEPNVSEKQVKIGSDLPSGIRNGLIKLLRENKDLFAWTSGDMPGIDPDFISHRLDVNPSAKPVTQKKRRVGSEKSKVIEEKVSELLQAGFVREVKYAEWLANTVLVKKANGKWRMCVDYTDLNKACPKDPYPLPIIDKLVDCSAGYQLLSFADAYSGYNQIPMYPPDQEKTAFITERATFCFTVMPFGLKNAGATYQRMMNKVFEGVIGSSMEVYIDDMITKSRKKEDHIADLAVMFERIRQYSMRLNPEKCTFGVPAGAFLGFMLTERGIEANPDKCRAILDMRSPSNVKEVQQLTGRLASLSRFLPKAAMKALPWYQLLKKNQNFEWDERCESAFASLKEFLSSPPILSTPIPGETLFLYLSVSNTALSSALVKEEAKGEAPIYFVSRALQGPELRYSKMEKCAFCLVLSARRLRQYFQSHQITVRTAQPIRQVLQKPDLAGRMMSWSIELSEFDLNFEPRKAIKSQILADFISEFTEPTSQHSSNCWTIYVDGSSNKKGSGAGVILENQDGIMVEYSLKFEFPTSNNQAEYEAVIAGLNMARELGAVQVRILSDSQLVVSQVNGDYQAKEPVLQKYLDKVKMMSECFSEFSISHIPRNSNVRADILSKLASTKGSENNKSLIQQSIPGPSIVMTVSLSSDWMDPIRLYLEHGILPSHPTESKILVRKSAHYVIIEGILYKRGMSCPLLKCLNPSEAEQVLEEVHGGVSSHHMGRKALARKILRAGYYWPTLVADSADHVRRCDTCQRHGDIYQKPPEELHSLLSPWPFYQWGMDIIGPFPLAPGQLKFVIVAVDYFTKWIEAEPLATITSCRIQKFFFKQVICRFGIPHSLVTDNGSQFASSSFKELAEEFNINHHFSSVEHPQTNGQAEAANKLIIKGLKRRLEKANGKWAEVLPEVLWSLRTTISTSTGETPFKLTYGCDAVIPIQRQLPTCSLNERSTEENDSLIKDEMTMIEELRAKAAEQIKKSKDRQKIQHNKTVVPRSFLVGDLVLRRADIGLKNAKEGKLARNWEGPYRIKSKTNSGGYRIETLTGSEIKNTWNADKLKLYFS